jgi:hydroxymethylglutaryl-CoA lyase
MSIADGTPAASHPFTPVEPFTPVDFVEIVEVGPRDGFQMESRFIPTEAKIEIIELLVRAGLRELEVTSFVNPRVIPQLADAERVVASLGRSRDVRYWALVPNVRGAERALAAGIKRLHLVVCATETYNQRNVGLTIGASLDALRQIRELAGRRCQVAVTLAAAFGCPFEGQPADDRLVELADRCLNAGADELGLADSVGLGHPLLVRRIVRRIRRLHPELVLRMHLHDTRGLGLANAVAALEEGVVRFDTSFGGLGGCPLVQGASGNIATEDLLHLCSDLGIATGVDIDLIRQASRMMEALLGRPLPSRVLHAGTREELYTRNRAVPPQ